MFYLNIFKVFFKVFYASKLSLNLKITIILERKQVCIFILKSLLKLLLTFVTTFSQINMYLNIHSSLTDYLINFFTFCIVFVQYIDLKVFNFHFT